METWPGYFRSKNSFYFEQLAEIVVKYFIPCTTKPALVICASLILAIAISCGKSSGPRLPAGQYRGVGMVISISPDRLSTEINHEEIKDYMPAMQMQYYVKDKPVLDGIVAGDKVEFIIATTSGTELIISMHKL